MNPRRQREQVHVDGAPKQSATGARRVDERLAGADRTSTRRRRRPGSLAAGAPLSLLLHVDELSVTKSIDGADWLAAAARGGGAGGR